MRIFLSAFALLSLVASLSASAFADYKTEKLIDHRNKICEDLRKYELRAFTARGQNAVRAFCAGKEEAWKQEMSLGTLEAYSRAAHVLSRELAEAPNPFFHMPSYGTNKLTLALALQSYHSILWLMARPPIDERKSDLTEEQRQVLEVFALPGEEVLRAAAPKKLRPFERDPQQGMEPNEAEGAGSAL